MRGIEFINIPTTTLSQIDSSIGGKVAINLDGIKNCVGAFWQPKMVLIDPDVLATLPQRHINNGLAEALKAGLIRDESLFELFETDDPMEHIEKILYKSLMMKKKVVEIDEREIGRSPDPEFRTYDRPWYRELLPSARRVPWRSGCAGHDENDQR